MPAPSTRPDTDLTLALEILRTRFGHESFRPGQEEALARILAGEDLTVVMPTGGGKSLCYQVPALVRDGLTLVVSPLIALMKDQVEALEARGIAATFVNSTLDARQQRERLDSAVAGRLRILYVAPERLATPLFLRAMRDRPPILVAVDEAHCISSWGHDFRPAYLSIGTFLDVIAEAAGKRPQVIALTATATPRVRADIAKNLAVPPDRLLITGFRRENLRLVARECDRKADKLDQVVQVARGVAGSGIVYTATRKDAESVAEALRDEGMEVGLYHAGLPDDERSRVQEDFLSGRARIIVATNAFGMGIDKPDVRFVVHHSLPGSVEAYYQEAGRAGRDGRISWCVLLHGRQDRFIHEFFLDGNCPTEENVRALWSSLLRRREDVLTLSIADLARESGVSDMATGGALRLLEDANLIARGDSSSATAEPGTDQRSRRRSTTILARGIEPAELRRRLEPLLRASGERRQRGLDRVAATERYAWGRGCRHRALLRYFGDDLEGECGACDSCCDWKPKQVAETARPASDRPPDQYKGQPKNRAAMGGGRKRRAVTVDLDEYRSVALEAVSAVHRRFGMIIARQVLRGSRAQKLLRAGLESCPAYGALARFSDAQVDEVLAALEAEELIESSGGPRPVIVLTEEGRLRLAEGRR